MKKVEKHRITKFDGHSRSSGMLVTKVNLEQFNHFLDRVIGESRLAIAGDKIGIAFRKESKRNEELLKKFFDKLYLSGPHGKNARAHI